MSPVTAQLIIALLPIAQRLVFDIGGKLVEINTSDMNDPVKIREAFAAANAEEFPQLRFLTPVTGNQGPGTRTGQ